MGVFESLFGKAKAPVNQPKEPAKDFREMTGSIQQFEHIDVLVLSHVVEDDRRPFTEKKKQLYFAEFANESFMFDGQVRSLLVTNAYVNRDLAGSLNAYLFSQTGQEVLAEHRDFGEYPTPIGELYLDLVEGTLPCVKVSKWHSPKRWSNENYKIRYGRS